MIMTEWNIECPVCGYCMWGDEELCEDSTECPNCGSILLISTAIDWDTRVEVKEEHRNDLLEEEDDE